MNWTFFYRNLTAQLKQNSLCKCGKVSSESNLWFGRRKSTWKKFIDSRNNVFSKTALSLALMTLSGLGGYYMYRKFSIEAVKEQKRKEKELMKRTVDDRNKPRVRYFQAIDTEGKTVTDWNFKNKWLLVYFGFTNCPDICPEVLENLSTTIDKCKPVVELLPVFISVDAHRDTPEKIKKYLEDFHPNFVGLTGSSDQLSKLFGTFGVYARANPADDDGDYIIDHTVITYLVAPDGRILDMFTRYQELDKVYESIAKHVKNFKKIEDDMPYTAAFR